MRVCKYLGQWNQSWWLGPCLVGCLLESFPPCKNNGGTTRQGHGGPHTPASGHGRCPNRLVRNGADPEGPPRWSCRGCSHSQPFSTLKGLYSPASIHHRRCARRTASPVADALAPARSCLIRDLCRARLSRPPPSSPPPIQSPPGSPSFSKTHPTPPPPPLAKPRACSPDLKPRSLWHFEPPLTLQNASRIQATSDA